VEDIAAAAGVGRRTSFRYLGSENDLVRGDFPAQLDRLRELLDEGPPEVGLLEALRDGRGAA
jgi:AcrR family transcriptional regulator